MSIMIALDSQSTTISQYSDIDHLCAWGDKSLMSFNRDECHVMSFVKTGEVYNYTMKKAAISLPLNRCDQEHDFGVLFTPDLKFSSHIKLITRKANSVIGIIKHDYASHPLYQSGSPPFRICF